MPAAGSATRAWTATRGRGTAPAAADASAGGSDAGDAPGAPAVGAIGPRRNRFERAAAGQGPGRRRQVTAANLDHVLAVAALRDPPLREGRLDRFAVACEALGLPLVVALSKADLVPAGEAQAARATYVRAGYRVHVLAAARGE